MRRSFMWPVAVLAACIALGAGPRAARAQDSSQCTEGCPDGLKTAPPPPPVYYPPPGYPPPGYPPPGYPPPGYPPPAYPPPVYYAPAPPAPPPVVRYEQRRMYGLMTAGLITFGASWTVNAVMAYLANDGQLAIPIAGPIMEAVDYDKSSHNDADKRIAIFGLTFDALIETAGLAMAIGGMVAKHKVKVYGPPKVTIAPAAVRGGFGLAASGRF
jgi:hypothetical protein